MTRTEGMLTVAVGMAFGMAFVPAWRFLFRRARALPQTQVHRINQ
ncbi:hypothetical protein [Embleya scabrispora]|nr:hypothetical protein [Embleya scabrispora]